MTKKPKNKNDGSFNDKSLLGIVWNLPNKRAKVYKFRKGFLTQFEPEDPKAFLRAFQTNDISKLNSLPINIIQAYHGDMPKILFNGSGTVKSLDVAISSTQAEDESLLHKLYQTIVESE